MASRIAVVEVSPRDGLQNEKTWVSTENKVSLIRRAIAAGARRLEAASFVSPKAVPQMADAEDVMQRLRDEGVAKDVTLIGLALNRRGVDRALAAGVDDVNVAIAASETFNRRNQNAAIADNVGELEGSVRAAQAQGVPVSLTIMTAFGCPFEGEVAPEAVVRLAEAARAAGVAEVALADTIGVADPVAVEQLMHRVRAVIGPLPLRMHFHNTRNTGIANAFAALRAGAQVLDSSIGGLGGCPFAPRATGNIATEDLIYMLDRMDVATGYKLPALIDTAHWLEAECGLKPPSMVAKAGGFPVPA
ncbi:MAG: hydroxymethylglutaryl-CoA lyase [Hyphomonadaceae bacterium]